MEQQLSKSLGVEQNVIREALIDLAHGRFVRRIANRGASVTELSLAEARKLGDVRASLEGLAAAAGDRESFYEADLAFHRALRDLADNEYLAQLLEQIVVPLFAFFIMLYMRKDGAAESFLEAVAAHEKLLADLKASGPEAGAAAMRELVDLSLQHQQGLISQQ